MVRNNSATTRQQRPGSRLQGRVAGPHADLPIGTRDVLRSEWSLRHRAQTSTMALVTESQRRGSSPADRVSALLDSKPWLSAALTIVLSLVIWEAGRTAFESDAGTRPWLNFVVLAFVIYAAVVLLILVPRVYVPRADGPRGQARLSYLGWAFAVSPRSGSARVVGGRRRSMGRHDRARGDLRASARECRRDRQASGRTLLTADLGLDGSAISLCLRRCARPANLSA